MTHALVTRDGLTAPLNSLSYFNFAPSIDAGYVSNGKDQFQVFLISNDVRQIVGDPKSPRLYAQDSNGRIDEYVSYEPHQWQHSRLIGYYGTMPGGACMAYRSDTNSLLALDAISNGIVEIDLGQQLNHKYLIEPYGGHTDHAWGFALAPDGRILVHCVHNDYIIPDYESLSVFSHDGQFEREFVFYDNVNRPPREPFTPFALSMVQSFGFAPDGSVVARGFDFASRKQLLGKFSIDNPSVSTPIDIPQDVSIFHVLSAPDFSILYFITDRGVYHLDGNDKLVFSYTPSSSPDSWSVPGFAKLPIKVPNEVLPKKATPVPTPAAVAVIVWAGLVTAGGSGIGRWVGAGGGIFGPPRKEPWSIEAAMAFWSTLSAERRDELTARAISWMASLMNDAHKGQAIGAVVSREFGFERMSSNPMPGR